MISNIRDITYKIWDTIFEIRNMQLDIRDLKSNVSSLSHKFTCNTLKIKYFRH